jgi:hypothetical protein
MLSSHVRAQRLLVWGMLGMLAFLIALAALHVINVVWPPSAETLKANPGAWVLGQPRHISAYALGPGSQVWFVGVIALGLGMMAFAVGLVNAMPRAKHTRISCWLLAAAGLTMLFLDVFKTDAVPYAFSTAGALHDLAAVASLTLQCSAMVLLSESGNRDPTWQRVVGASPAWSAVAIVLSLAWGFLDAIFSPFEPAWKLGAAVQRAVGVFVVFWMLMVAWRARNLVAQGEVQPSSVPTES